MSQASQVAVSTSQPRRGGNSSSRADKLGYLGAAVILQRDIFAVVVRTGGVRALDFLQAEQLEVRKQSGSTDVPLPNLTAEQLQQQTARVKGTACAGWYSAPR